MLEVRGVTHRYGDVRALEKVSLSADAGEFLTILGESGSGKTTLLKIIAGLETPTEIERLAIGGEDVTDVPAYHRNCTTVFQHYALFPQMSVRGNVEYGLRVRGVPPAARAEEAMKALDLVRLAEKYNRRIHQLSGGEKQRVALARALVTRPAVLLLDEPIGALDEKLRQDMQVELIELQRALGMTFVYITHSQEEALAMGDRVILMRHGRIAQAGRPSDLFERPVSRFVANFMGVENLLEAELVEASGEIVTGRIGSLALRGRWCGQERPQPGATICFGVRAERVHIEQGAPPEGEGINLLPARPDKSLYRLKYVDQSARTDGGPIRAHIWDRSRDVSRFDHVWWSLKDSIAFAPD